MACRLQQHNLTRCQLGFHRRRIRRHWERRQYTGTMDPLRATQLALRQLPQRRSAALVTAREAARREAARREAARRELETAREAVRLPRYEAGHLALAIVLLGCAEGVWCSLPSGVSVRAPSRARAACEPSSSFLNVPLRCAYLP
eukprot:COSAG02_NODE_28577_length_587_cov_0.653689_2_plen_144_part_01